MSKKNYYIPETFISQFGLTQMLAASTDTDENQGGSGLQSKERFGYNDQFYEDEYVKYKDIDESH